MSVSITNLAGMFRRLETTYRAGIDLRSAIDQESKRGSQSFQRELRAVHQEIDSGEALASALTKRQGSFPQLVIATVDAGERGGRLEDSFKRLADHYESLVQFRRRLLTMMAWPVFELCFSICIIGLLIIIMEWVTSSSGQPSVDWLGLGLSSGGYLALYIFCVFAGFGAIAFLVVGTQKGWFGTLPMRIARRIPVLGGIIVHLAMSRFAWTLGIAIDAGISAMNSAQLALRSTENFFYTRHENDVALAIRGGKEINESLRATGEFPDELLMYLQNGETAGEIPEMMTHVADTFQKKAEAGLKTLAMIGFVLTFLLVAALIIGAIFFLFINFILGPINDAASMGR